MEEYKLIEDLGFDENKKIFRAVYQYQGTTFSIIKGAPESVIFLSEQDREMEQKLTEALSIGYRTIAVAQKKYLRNPLLS